MELTADQWRGLIRRRPGLYIGDTEEFGLSLLLETLLLLGFNAGRAGRVRAISVELLADGACQLSLDGLPWPLPPWTSPLASLERIGGIEAVLRVRAGAEGPRRAADRGRSSSEPGRWTGRAAP